MENEVQPYENVEEAANFEINVADYYFQDTDPVMEEEDLDNFQEDDFAIRDSILKMAEDIHDPIKDQRAALLQKMTQEVNEPQGQSTNEEDGQLRSQSSFNIVQTLSPEETKRRDPDGEDLDIAERCASEVIIVPEVAQKIHDLYSLFMTNYQKPLQRLEEMSGFLSKKNKFGIWQSRYFLLRERTLKYFMKDNLTSPRGYLNFDQVFFSCEVLGDPNSSNIFKLSSPGSKKAFILKANSHEDMKKWVLNINRHLDASRGVREKMTKVSLKPEYWREERICEKKFLELADTGDLLLFQSDNMASKLQRTFTGSQYDHVALLLRYENSEVVLLEATSRVGVGLCTWSYFKRNNWHWLYNKLVYRPLVMNRSEELITDLEKFIKTVIGLKYNVSASKLLKRTAEDHIITPTTTYFCSELIAAIFKHLKLLPPEKPASKYWPGDFSKEKTLPFAPGASLGNEFVIDFDL